MNSKLKKAAEEYINSGKFESPNGYGMREVKEAFIEGATSETAKEYWHKQFKKEKLEFALEDIAKLAGVSVEQIKKLLI